MGKMESYELTINGDWRVTLPQGLRDALGIGPGDHVAYDPDGQGGFILRKARSEEVPVKHVKPTSQSHP